MNNLAAAEQKQNNAPVRKAGLTVFGADAGQKPPLPPGP